MTKTLAVWLLTAVLLTDSSPAQAQPGTKIPRIAFLSAVSPSTISARVDAFKQGLRELGYEDGRNIIIEWRYADGKLDRLPALAAELVALKVDIIVSGGPTVTRPVKQATTSIPIVMAVDDDPIGAGFVASLAQPGGNITGLSALSPEIGGKQLEILKETLPKLARVAVIGNTRRAGNAQMLKEAELAAVALKTQLQYLDAPEPQDIEAAFRAAAKGRADAVLVLRSPAFIAQRKQTADMAVKQRIPVMYPWPENVEDGGLMTYGVSINDLFRRAATYVDKILKGRRPVDLPVEQPTKFEFIVNLKAAKQIGLTIPPNVLVRADRVIR